jgi:hypothetical protein
MAAALYSAWLPVKLQPVTVTDALPAISMAPASTSGALLLASVLLMRVEDAEPLTQMAPPAGNAGAAGDGVRQCGAKVKPCRAGKSRGRVGGGCGGLGWVGWTRKFGC